MREKNYLEYEKNVIIFLRKFSENGVFDTKRIKELVKKDMILRKDFKKEMEKITNYKNPSLSNEFVDIRGKNIFGWMLVVLIIISLISFFLAGGIKIGSFNDSMDFILRIMLLAMFSFLLVFGFLYEKSVSSLILFLILKLSYLYSL